MAVNQVNLNKNKFIGELQKMDKMLKNSYWNSRGKYQEEYKMLHALLVPESIRAKTLHGEALRCIVNIYYDRYNNGHFNNDIFEKYYGFLNWFSDSIVENSNYYYSVHGDFNGWIDLLERKPEKVGDGTLEYLVDCVIECCWVLEFGEVIKELDL